MAKKPTTEKEIAKALQAAGGFITTAADILGVTHSAVSQRIKKSPYLQEIRKATDEKHLDLSESELIKLIESGNLGAICFYLKCKGKGRGYVEKQILSVEGPIDITVKYDG